MMLEPRFRDSGDKFKCTKKMKLLNKDQVDLHNFTSIVLIIIIIIIYRTFLALMLEFRALYSYMNKKDKLKFTTLTKY